MADETVQQTDAQEAVLAARMQSAGYRFWRCTPLNERSTPYWSAMPIKGSVMHHFSDLEKIEPFLARVANRTVYSDPSEALS